LTEKPTWYSRFKGYARWWVATEGLETVPASPDIVLLE
jgi:hypothetical protein